MQRVWKRSNLESQQNNPPTPLAKKGGVCAPEAPRRLPGAVAGSGAGRAPLPPDSGLTGACLRRLSCPPRSTWTATCWPCPTTCLCTTTPSTGGGPAAWTRQKVRPLLIWKMVGTRYVSSFYLRCFLFFAPSFLSLFCVRLSLPGQTHVLGAAPSPPLPCWRGRGAQLSHPPHPRGPRFIGWSVSKLSFA